MLIRRWPYFNHHLNITFLTHHTPLEWSKISRHLKLFTCFDGSILIYLRISALWDILTRLHNWWENSTTFASSRSGWILFIDLTNIINPWLRMSFLRNYQRYFFYWVLFLTYKSHCWLICNPCLWQCKFDWVNCFHIHSWPFVWLISFRCPIIRNFILMNIFIVLWFS